MGELIKHFLQENFLNAKTGAQVYNFVVENYLDFKQFANNINNPSDHS